MLMLDTFGLHALWSFEIISRIIKGVPAKIL